MDEATLRALLQDPAFVKELMSLSGNQDQQGLAGDQMGYLQAQALRAQSPQHSTGLGAALGGLGSALSGGFNAYNQSKTRGQQQDLIGQRQTVLQQLAELLRKSGSGGLPGAQPMSGQMAGGAPPSDSPMVQGM